MSSGSGEPLRRAQVRVLGRVQGVGFRYFVQRTAVARGLSGFVLNQEDGAVSLELQGPDPDLQVALSEIRRGPHLARVDHWSLDWIVPRPDETGFSVRG